MKLRHLLHTFIAASTLTLLYLFIELISGNDLSPRILLWNLLANFLIVGVLGFYTIHSSYQSYRLVLATFAIFYVIGNFNIIIEGVIFGVLEIGFLSKSIFFGIPYSMAGAFLVVWIFGQWGEKTESTPSFLPRSVLSWIGKILLANFLYIFFYIIAGTLVEKLFPGFTEYYADKLPSIKVFLMTNMFFRGFVFVAIAILIDRSLNDTKVTKALLVGLVFSIIGGVALVIPPNEFMPQFIRVAHGFEMGISNFLYGVCVFLIVRSKEK